MPLISPVTGFPVPPPHSDVPGRKNKTRCVTSNVLLPRSTFQLLPLPSSASHANLHLREINTIANILITLDCSGFRIRFRVLLLIPPQKLRGVPTSQFPSSPKMNFLGTASFSRRLFFLIFKGSISKELSSKCFEHSRWCLDGVPMSRPML